ncbi:L antigen family member 3-like isoform X1 [Narcine bancroftii]|uniref:L antigen family member 3-like isoform X1 n=1 Tax=Narcine bancroftii TaxID=1343680 RepID=UPI003831C510
MTAVANGGPRLRVHLSIPFPSEREARIALRSLSPDAEHRKGGISRTLSVEDCTLLGSSTECWSSDSHGKDCQDIVEAKLGAFHWEADEARILRVAVNSFLDHLALVLETMDRFGGLG